jgi:uncharacterized protein with ParB-like and HNH nuclease domain
MEKKTLSNILEGKIFQIPDYQRGYAWEVKTMERFWARILMLIDDKKIPAIIQGLLAYQPIDKTDRKLLWYKKNWNS